MNKRMIGVLLLLLATGFSAQAAGPKKARPVRREVKYSQDELQQRQLKAFHADAMCRAIDDMGKNWPAKFDKATVAKWKTQARAFGPLAKGLLGKNDPASRAQGAKIVAFQRDVLLRNPLLDGEKVLVMRRYFGPRAKGIHRTAAGFPGLNSYTNDVISRGEKWDNELVVISDFRAPKPKVTTLYQSPIGKIIRDVDLDFDAKRIMFSTFNDHNRWAVYQVDADGKNLTELTPNNHKDIHFFDSCYLANGEIITASTAGLQGLPCEGGGRAMVNLYRVNPKTKKVRQLTFEQDSDWHPTVLPNGRVMYLRWEYTDIPHYFSRILFSMNPDGTDQREYYGSGSYFPTAFKHARSIPGHPTKVIGIISGHHANPESGRLAIIDPTLGRKYPFKYTPQTKDWMKETKSIVGGRKINIRSKVLPAEETGFVQEIPGFGKDVVGNVYDDQGTAANPMFIYPEPLNENYHLVTLRTDNGLWGIYLVDTFDNMTLLYEEAGCAMFEPILFKARPKPQAKIDQVIPGKTTANVFITDVYHGRSLQVPKGKAKTMRIIAYNYAPMRSGGHTSVGVQSSWDIKRILGTVPIERDGSVSFEIPANTPVAFQPLDAEGRAMTLMRSWLVAMPGETVSCTGCHETMNEVSPIPSKLIAAQRPASKIKLWLGPPRPIAFQATVMPAVKKYCVSCHDGKSKNAGCFNFSTPQLAYKYIHPFVRRPGPESDLELEAMEYHASTSPLIQILEKNHHGLTLDKMDRPSRERLYTWIDANAPWRGKWGSKYEARREELAKLYANVDIAYDTEWDDHLKKITKRIASIKPQKPKRPAPVKPDGLKAKGFPFDAATAAKRQVATGQKEQTLDLGGQKAITMIHIPAGQFVMGSQRGYANESPRRVATIAKPFWMASTETTNAQYAQFDAEHDTRYLGEHGKDHALPGYIANHANQPVSRVTWKRAMAFCEWLAKKTGKKVTLPTEAQWEWAARAGTDTDFYFGNVGVDFGKHANLADSDRLNLATGWDGGSIIHKRRPYRDNHMVDTKVYPLRDTKFKDNWFVVDYVAQVTPNAFGLYDMIGNVAEFTRDAYKPYPYRSTPVGKRRVAVRGGSWHERPKDATAAVRFGYEPWQKVFNVGFRVIIEE